MKMWIVTTTTSMNDSTSKKDFTGSVIGVDNEFTVHMGYYKEDFPLALQSILHGNSAEEVLKMLDAQDFEVIPVNIITKQNGLVRCLLAFSCSIQKMGFENDDNINMNQVEDGLPVDGLENPGLYMVQLWQA